MRGGPLAGRSGAKARLSQRLPDGSRRRNLPLRPDFVGPPASARGRRGRARRCETPAGSRNPRRALLPPSATGEEPVPGLDPGMAPRQRRSDEYGAGGGTRLLLARPRAPRRSPCYESVPETSVFSTWLGEPGTYAMAPRASSPARRGEGDHAKHGGGGCRLSHLGRSDSGQRGQGRTSRRRQPPPPPSGWSPSPALRGRMPATSSGPTFICDGARSRAEDLIRRGFASSATDARVTLLIFPSPAAPRANDAAASAISTGARPRRSPR